MFDKNKDLLPVGSVVLLKKGKLRLMIIGLLPVLEEDNTYYDYCGCLYPAGIINLQTIGFFNRDSIESVYSIGLMDDDSNDFLSQIRTKESELINEMKYMKKENDNLDNIFEQNSK